MNKQINETKKQTKSARKTRIMSADVAESKIQHNQDIEKKTRIYRYMQFDHSKQL